MFFKRSRILTFIILGFYLFTNILYFSCIRVKANTFVIDPATIQSISSGIRGLAWSGSTTQGIIPVEDFSTFDFNNVFKTVNNNNTLVDCLGLDSSDFTSVPLSSADVSSLESALNNGQSVKLYDVNNNLITDYSGLYRVDYDNGYFSGTAICDSQGRLVQTEKWNNNELESLEPVARVNFGGSALTSSQFAQFYPRLLDSAELSDFTFNYSNEDITNVSYYLQFSSNFNDVNGSAYLYISNIYAGLDVLCPDPQSLESVNGYTYQIGYYTNNLGLFSWNNNFVRGEGFKVQTGTFRVGQHTYKHRVFMGSGVMRSGSVISSNSVNCYQNSFSYNENIAATTYAPTSQAMDIDFDKGYSLTGVSKFVQTLEDEAEGTVNPSFNPDLPIGVENYPLVIPYPNVISMDIDSFPFPWEQQNDITDNPSIELNPPIFIDPEIPNEYPLVNSLENRFPFSIPFDIYKMVKGLSVPREAPNLHFIVNIPVINYDWEINFDLSAWDPVVSIFRNCFLILFIISIGVWAYSHFFGQ